MMLDWRNVPSDIVQDSCACTAFIGPESDSQLVATWRREQLVRTAEALSCARLMRWALRRPGKALVRPQSDLRDGTDQAIVMLWNTHLGDRTASSSGYTVTRRTGRGQSRPSPLNDSEEQQDSTCGSPLLGQSDSVGVRLNTDGGLLRDDADERELHRRFLIPLGTEAI